MNQKTQPKIISDAAVERIDDRSVRICWETAVQTPVAVYPATTPDAVTAKEPAVMSDDGCARIHGLDPLTRYYFELVAESDRMIVAERRVKLEGAVNFRDLGGYETTDGRRLKWGRLFRADGLSRLSDVDLAMLERMGIRRVFDFRTVSECEDAPDRLPGNGAVRHIHLPVTHGKFDFVEAVKRLKKGDTSWLTPDYMINGYINNLESFPEVWATVIRHAVDTDGQPLVFHCTGGKDRTGTCGALILLALGVPEETVIDDHQLSNIYIAELMPKLYKMMSDHGIDPEAIFPYLTAPRDCIVSVLDYITDHYGTAAEYLLRKSSITEAELDRFRMTLLA